MNAGQVERDWHNSPHDAFPRVTMCDFNVRRLGNVHRYTVQCTLPINLWVYHLLVIHWRIQGAHLVRAPPPKPERSRFWHKNFTKCCVESWHALTSLVPPYGKSWIRRCHLQSQSQCTSRPFKGQEDWRRITQILLTFWMSMDILS